MMINRNKLKVLVCLGLMSTHTLSPLLSSTPAPSLQSSYSDPAAAINDLTNFLGGNVDTNGALLPLDSNNPSGVTQAQVFGILQWLTNNRNSNDINSLTNAYNTLVTWYQAADSNGNSLLATDQLQTIYNFITTLAGEYNNLSMQQSLTSVLGSGTNLDKITAINAALVSAQSNQLAMTNATQQSLFNALNTVYAARQKQDLADLQTLLNNCVAANALAAADQATVQNTMLPAIANELQSPAKAAPRAVPQKPVAKPASSEAAARAPEKPAVPVTAPATTIAAPSRPAAKRVPTAPTPTATTSVRPTPSAAPSTPSGRRGAFQQQTTKAPVVNVSLQMATALQNALASVTQATTIADKLTNLNSLITWAAGKAFVPDQQQQALTILLNVINQIPATDTVSINQAKNILNAAARSPLFAAHKAAVQQLMRKLSPAAK